MLESKLARVRVILIEYFYNQSICNVANLGYLIFFHAKVDHMDGSFGSFSTL